MNRQNSHPTESPSPYPPKPPLPGASKEFHPGQGWEAGGSVGVGGGRAGGGGTDPGVLAGTTVALLRAKIQGLV